MIFCFVTIGTNNLAKSKFFYDELLQSINIFKVTETERYIGYAKKDTLEKVEFYIMMPHNKQNATYGNGAMITFDINTKIKVESFYNLALKLGATNEGLPGPRHGVDYYAYFRDLEGNKICAFSSDKF
jgi:predicted lactoylglutathione lyase